MQMSGDAFGNFFKHLACYGWDEIANQGLAAAAERAPSCRRRRPQPLHRRRRRNLSIKESFVGGTPDAIAAAARRAAAATAAALPWRRELKARVEQASSGPPRPSSK